MSFIGRTTAKTVARMKEGVKSFDNKIEKLYNKHSEINEKYDRMIKDAVERINAKRKSEHIENGLRIKDIQDAKQKAEEAIIEYERIFTK